MENATSCGQQLGMPRRHVGALMLAVAFSCGCLQQVWAGSDNSNVAKSSSPAVRATAKVPSGVALSVAAAPSAVNMLNAEELAIAQQVERGHVSCELGVSVSVTEDAKMPGHFNVQTAKYRFRMVPVLSSTGAIRLEDKQAGAVWLQLPHKSMLMSQKLGSRLADACVSPKQAQMALALEKNPPAALLELAPTVVAARGLNQ